MAAFGHWKEDRFLKEIKLTRGKVAVVDDEDYGIVGGFKWHASQSDRDVWYAARMSRINGKRISIKLHRSLLNAPSGLEVDHIDGNGLNNQRANLRICTRAENSRNSAKYSNGACPYKGVYDNHGRWKAEITVNRRRITKCGFATAEAAARAYDELAKQHHGEFAQLNFS